MIGELMLLERTPSEESCARVGEATYELRSAIECRVFRRMLLRTDPPPPDAAVELIHGYPHVVPQLRWVYARYSNLAGADYAVRLKSRLPARWDAVARAEIIWHSVRWVLQGMACRRWIALADIPQEYRELEPPSTVTQVLGDREPLYAGLHAGGPFEAQPDPSLGGEWVSNVFPPREEALVLGRVDCEGGSGLVVRLARGGLRFYNLSLSRRLRDLSGILVAGNPGSFLVPVGSHADPVLSAMHTRDWISGPEFIAPADAGGESWESWQIQDGVLVRSVPLSMAA